MRLLLLNGNTSSAMTEKLYEAARCILPPDVELIPVTARFGAETIASRAAYAVACHAVLDAYAEFGGEADAVVLACFGDPGLAALREVARVPVFAMAEAGCRRAAEMVPGRFCIVTGGAAWGPMLTEYVASIGLGPRLAGVRVIEADGGRILSDPQAAQDALLKAARAGIEQDGAELVILGGGGMVGQVEALSPLLPVPVIDGLTPALEMAVEAAGRKQPGLAAPIKSSGLGPALTKLFGG